MVFFLNYLYSIISAYCIGKHYSHMKISFSALLGLLLPIFLIWLAICGGQNDVGTDYWSYYNIFNGEGIEVYRHNNEYLFVWIISFFNFLGFYGQSLFFVFYGINFYFFYLILKRIDLRYIFLFILLYITVSSLFNNQLNGLRQATAIYIGTYALLLILEEKKLKGFFFIVVSMLVHQSAFILLIVFLAKKVIERFSSKYLLILLCISLFLSFIFRVEMLDFIAPYLSDAYAYYITGHEYEDKSIIVKITKYIFIPFYVLSIVRFKKMEMTEQEIIYFKWGFWSFCMRLMILNLSVVGRIFDYFLILSIFPFYYYLRYLFRNNRRFQFVIIISLLSLFYGLKVTVFARSEYLCKSVYF